MNYNPIDELLLTMGKKRKSIATSLDEVDRTMYASFCSAANSLSQLYTQSMNHQKLSFQAGERHGLVRFPLYLFDLLNICMYMRLFLVGLFSFIEKLLLFINQARTLFVSLYCFTGFYYYC